MLRFAFVSKNYQLMNSFENDAENINQVINTSKIILF